MFVTQFNWAGLVLLFAAFALDINSTLPAQAQESRTVQLRQFDRMTASSGWILLDQHLYWTIDAGQSWEKIDLPVPPDGSIQDVEFLDDHRGWVLWTKMNSDGSSAFHLAQTADHGNTWTPSPLSLFEPGEVASYMADSQMGWFDGQTGWIAVKQESSSNFSTGSLFTTSDGGSSWSRVALPDADKLFFSTPQTGWAIGGYSSDRLFQTQNGGISWKKDVLPGLTQGPQAMAYLPVISGEQGVWVIATQGEENNLKVYSRNDSSGLWSLTGQKKIDGQPGLIGLSILDAKNFVAVIPRTRSIVRMVNGRLGELENQDGLSASITGLDMVSLEVGWAKWIESDCSPKTPSNTASCSSTIRLLQTTDGGVTWTGIKLPLIQSDKISVGFNNTGNEVSSVDENLSLENTEILIGQGFDKCEIPTLSQMQTWWNSSPYEAVNLYIGGSSRACANSALTSTYVFQLYQQGWKFIPTWVGPQAPCTAYLSRMSSDPATSYQQGIEQADLAVDRLAALGLTGPAKAGSVVFYDIENYGTDTACRSAVSAFMNGWVSQIHARGNIAGVYGSTLCNTGLSDFLGIANVPDTIWAARWYHSLGSGYYNPNASVWGLGSCLPDSVWVNHQRIRQYEGDHNETWGGLTLNIDSNVLDSVVAIPFDYPFVSSIVRSDSNPTHAETVHFTVTFSKVVTGINNADFVLTTTGVIGASIINVSGSGTTYTVTVNTGSGNGTIRLDVMDNDSIRDESNYPLGGAGAGNGNFTYGERYTILTDADTTGVFRPSNGALYLKNSNATGFADVQINYGQGGDYPVTGDWDGNGTATIGIYRNGTFMLRNSNTIGFAQIVFPFGQAGDQPIAGDWNGDGVDTIGVYRSSSGTFFLRNSNTAGPADMIFSLGIPGDVGIAGDWTGKGFDTTGVFRPSNGALYLKHTNATGFADIQINYGQGGDYPVTGDWDDNGTDTIGVYRNGTFMLRNSNTIGFAQIVFNLGVPGDMPIAGNWDGIP